MQASNLAQAGHAFFALTHSMNMHGRAAAMVTPIGDKKTLLPAESAVSSSGCAGRGRLKSGTSRKKKWKHARLQGAQRREGVCVGLGCRGPECDFACFLDSRPRDLGTYYYYFIFASQHDPLASLSRETGTPHRGI